VPPNRVVQRLGGFRVVYLVERQQERRRSLGRFTPKMGYAGVVSVGKLAMALRRVYWGMDCHGHGRPLFRRRRFSRRGGGFV